MENGNIGKEKIISSLFWKLLEKSGAQIVGFIISIILARLIAPGQFGILALVTVFINLANVFVTGGLGTSLVQKKETDELDYNSIFYVSLAIAILLYIVIIYSSPFISRFYDFLELEKVLKVLGVSLLFGPFNTVQEAYLQKNMMFKKQLVVTLIAVIVSGTLGIVIAFNGYGVWALVIQQLSFSIVKTIALFIVVRWYPKPIFSFNRVKRLYSFGWKLLVGNLLNVISKDIRTLVIGFKYTKEDLAYYNKGDQLPSLIITNVNGSIQSVLLPTLSIYQDNKTELRAKTRRSIKISSYLLMPVMFGFAIVAEPMVKILLTDVWLPAVPYVQILSLSYALYPIHTANLQAITAVGRSDILLILEIIKVVISIGLLLILMPHGVFAIAVGTFIASILSSFLNAYPNKHLLEYSYKDQIKDVGSSILITIVMALFVYPIKLFIFSDYMLLVVQIVLGALIYLLLSYIFKVESFKYIIDTINSYVKKFKNRNMKSNKND